MASEKNLNYNEICDADGDVISGEDWSEILQKGIRIITFIIEGVDRSFCLSEETIIEGFVRDNTSIKNREELNLEDLLEKALMKDKAVYNFSLTRIKIDKSFIKELLNNETTLYYIYKSKYGADIYLSLPLDQTLLKEGMNLEEIQTIAQDLKKGGKSSKAFSNVFQRVRSVVDEEKKVLDERGREALEEMERQQELFRRRVDRRVVPVLSIQDQIGVLQPRITNLTRQIEMLMGQENRDQEMVDRLQTQLETSRLRLNELTNSIQQGNPRGSISDDRDDERPQNNNVGNIPRSPRGDIRARDRRDNPRARRRLDMGDGENEEVQDHDADFIIVLRNFDVRDPERVRGMLETGNISQDAINRGLVIMCGMTQNQDFAENVKEIIRILIQYGADVNYDNSLAFLKLFDGEDNGEEYRGDNLNLYLITLFIANGANIWVNDNELFYRFCANNISLEVLKLLVENGADIHWNDDIGLEVSVVKNIWVNVKYLLTHDYSPESKNRVLLIACNNGMDTRILGDVIIAPDIIELLLASGADATYNNNQPLRSAVETGLTEVIRVLLRNGADIHTENLIQICINSRDIWNYFWTIKCLLQNGARVNREDIILVRDKIRNSRDFIRENLLEVVDLLQDRFRQQLLENNQVISQEDEDFLNVVVENNEIFDNRPVANIYGDSEDEESEDEDYGD